MKSNVALALREWESLMGQSSVSTAASCLLVAETATFATSQKVPAVLFPQTREQVQECLQIAGRRGVPVYPVSTGKNWGYGSSVPVEDGCVLMNLSRMNRIVDFSEDLAYVTVEPGVTQRQLFAFLKDRKSGLWMDATGSSPECSMIGNALERGFGHTPYGDHSAQVGAFEVVLPNGQILETGFGRKQNAQAAAVYRWGLGPSFDGLFTQSNLGVVTRATFWLMPAPARFAAFFFRSDDENSLSGIIDALRPLRLNGTLRSAIHIGNDYRVLAGLRQYPWEEAGEATPLGPALIKKLRRQMKFGAWSGSGGLYGTARQVAEARRLVRAALRGKVDTLQFLTDRLFALATRFARPFGLSETLKLARPLYGLMQGVPTDRPLESVYWRKRMLPPAAADPDRDACGLLWCAPVAPAEGHHAELLGKLATEIVLRHGFEPMLSVTMITERALICVISISYDREVVGEDQRAFACFAELQAAIDQRGYIPYRLGIQSMEQMRSRGTYEDLLASIKHAVDPSGILAPGRYSQSTTSVRSTTR